MDPTSNSSKLRAAPTSHSAAGTTSIGESSKTGNRVGNTMRRGHSDGDVLSGSSRSYDRQVGDEVARDGETWMDFLRHSSNAGHSTEEQARIATRKAAIMAADRKRRFAGQQEEHSRRRSASSLAFGQTASDRMRQGISQQTAINHPLVVNPRVPDNQSGQRITDRPLPPRPIAERSPDRRSREITLPRWQPDAEVHDCPICDSHFSFWYRKHHCRKCGRVVCASCSPHRITIPRQFIVHSPQEADQHSTHELPTESTIIDLTDENEDDTMRSNGAISGQSHDYRIDPGLGGGQEVRLCNPCVPDPNPLPHLSFASPNRFTFNSFPSSENSARTARHTQPQPLLGSNSQERHYAPSRADSNQRTNNNFGSDSTAGVTSSTPFIGSSAPNRRQDHISGHSGLPPHLPPNYSSIYGSAPDPSFHERYTNSLLHQHQPSSNRHRHHASASNVSAPSRHHSMVDVNTPFPSRAVPQPVLREEDECPICHRALPPKSPGGSEVAREAHVNLCIESYFSNSSPQHSRPPPAAATAAAVAASVATPSQASGRAVAIYMNQPEGSARVSTAFFMPRRRTTGMVVYHATEKDCVGEDGERAQECVICFEEFAVGDEMGRLECLCKFHKACIRQWWDTKGPGACPVHQGGI